MPSATLVPVDHDPFAQPVSLVPVDHDPFSADDMIGRARAQLASQPERLQQPDLSAADQAAMQPETFANPYVRGLIDSAASLPRRAIENSQNSLNTGNYDPGPALEAAMLPMGTAAIAGLPLRAGEVALGAGPIRAYHGSPHNFDAFDMSKIGTGEGAQAYGHGLYFAENEGVAAAYKKNLSPASADIAPSWKGDGWQVTTRDGGNFDRQFFPTKEEAEAHAAKFNKGHMYQVDINADPEHFLDWDKPLSEQHPKVGEALRTLPHYDDNLGAGRVYESLSREMGSKGGQPYVSQALRDAGIPGIKYLDQGSRAAGDGSRNYVLFNDKLIDIVRKYAAAGIALPPAIAAEYARQFKPVDHDPFADPQVSYAAGLGL